MSDNTNIRPRVNAIEKIEHYIISNNLKENDRLPAERDLCQMWGISRTTIRNAIDFLVGIDLLYKIEGSGAYVAPKKMVRNITGVNNLSRSFKESGFQFTTKIISFRVIKANRSVAERLKINVGDDVYELIRLRILKAIPSFIETMYLDYKRLPNLKDYYSEKSSIYSIFQNIYKVKPIGGKETISVTYATSTESELLNIKENSPLFFAAGVTFSEDQVPLEFYKIIFRADQFRFSYTIDDRELGR